jgi:hypothetical protein
MNSNQRSFMAAENIGPSLFVSLVKSSGVNMGQVEVADVGQVAYGISHEGTREAPIPGVVPVHAIAGEPCMVYGPGDNCEVLCGEAVVAGQFVRPNAAGKAVVCAEGDLYSAQAVSTTTAADQKLKVTILRGTTPGSAMDVAVSRRQRFTIAEVNAGATVVAAVPGVRLRMLDVSLIAIGGAAGAATSVDIRGTQSATSVNLLAAAVAGLTQNTLLRAGATNAAVLAGGASFIANDANTPILINRTGSAVTTATHIDVLITYVKETV